MRELLDRVRGVLQRPRQALPLTLAESGEPKAVFYPYVAALAGLGAVALFLCDGLFGAWHPPTEIFNVIVPGGWVRDPLRALVFALITAALSVGAWAGLATAVSLSAPWFGGLRDWGGGFKAAAYMLTPVWLALGTLLFGAVPYLTWMPGVALVAATAWAAFIGTIALPLHLGTPDPRAPGHAIASLVATAVVTTGLYLLASRAVDAAWSAG